MTATLTPSARLGVTLTPRLPPFAFSDGNVDASWFAGDPGLTAVWSSLSVLASTGELAFIEAGQWLVERLDDPALADETMRFVRQESYHATVHNRLNGLLQSRGLPVDASRAYLHDLLAWVRKEAGVPVWSAMLVATEQVIGEMGHAILSQPQVLDGLEPTLRQLFLWHCYEEVEHSAAFHDSWVALFGADANARNLRLLGAAYITCILAVVWPLSALAMVPPSARGQRWRLRTWRAAGHQMLGRRGLLRGVVRNLRGIGRTGFHPFDVHDPKPLLDAWAQQAVEPGWQRGEGKPVRCGQKAGDVPAHQVGVRDVLRVGRLLGFTVKRTWQFHREVSAARAQA